MGYSSLSDYNSLTSDTSAFSSVFSSTMLIPTLIIGIISLVGLWRMFQKADKPGWLALIPIVNTYVLYEIIFDDGFAFLRLLIPFYNIYWSIKTMIGLAKAYGKDPIFAVGLVICAPVFYCVLGFDPNTYYAGPADF